MSIASEVATAKALIEGQRAELDATLSRLQAAADSAGPADGGGGGGGGSAAAGLTTKLGDIQSQLDGVTASVSDMHSDLAVERELSAAKALRDERAAIKVAAASAEQEAENAYARAKARIEADLAFEKSLTVARAKEAELERIRTDLRIKRQARERAELLYSTDLSRAVRRLRERELCLDRARLDLTSTYERQRLYDSVRRLRLARISLSDQIVDYDYRGRRLAGLYDYPALYDGVATRYYDVLSPYTAAAYPYYSTPYYPRYVWP